MIQRETLSPKNAGHRFSGIPPLLVLLAPPAPPVGSRPAGFSSYGSVIGKCVNVHTFQGIAYFQQVAPGEAINGQGVSEPDMWP